MKSEVLATALLPHTDRLYLDRLSKSEYQLTDVVTLEHQRLSGCWSLYWEDGVGGRAALIQLSVDGEAPLVVKCVEDVMKLDVGVWAGERFIVKPPLKEAIAQQSLDAALSKHLAAKVSVQVGSVAVEVAMQMWVMKRPRVGGLSVYWDLHQFFGLLGLTSYKKQASKWVYHNMPSWEANMYKSPGRHFILSRHANTSDTTKAAVPWYDRCLPVVAASSIAVLCLLSRWAYASAAQRGFRDQKARAAATDFVVALCREACGARSSSFDLYIMEDWVCAWPRPIPLDRTADKVRCAIDAAGNIDLKPLLHPEHIPSRTWAEWRAHLLDVAAETGSELMTVPMLLQCIVGDTRFDSLCCQVLWHLAKLLERRFAEDGRQADVAGASFAYEGGTIKVGSNDFELRICGYVLGTVAESAKHQVVSLACDKATPAGLSLQNNVLVFGNNRAVICVPMARRRGVHDPCISVAMLQLLALFSFARFSARHDEMFLRWLGV